MIPHTAIAWAFIFALVCIGLSLTGLALSGVRAYNRTKDIKKRRQARERADASVYAENWNWRKGATLPGSYSGKVVETGKPKGWRPEAKYIPPRGRERLP